MGQTRGSNEDRRVMNVSRIECTQDSAFDTHEHANVAEDTLGKGGSIPPVAICRPRERKWREDESVKLSSLDCEL